MNAADTLPALTYGGNIVRAVFDTPPANGRDARAAIVSAMRADRPGATLTGALGKPYAPGKYRVAFADS